MKQLYIGGEWVAGYDAKPNVNPSDLSDIIDDYAQSDDALTQAAIDAARAAFPAWANSGPQLRHDILKSVADEIMARKDELGNLLAREEGKTLPEAVAETIRASQIFRFFSGECLRTPGERLESVRPNVGVEITREPVGVVGVITPWNFPLAIPAWKIAPAFAYGNCVVFKPAGLVPGCAWALADIIARAGIPTGVFNLVIGAGHSVGKVLTTNLGVDAVTFTGSVETGKKIATDCAARLAKFQLEMGGKNPLVVLDDSSLDVSIECAINGAFFSTGQRCTASSRLIVTENIHDRFVAGVKERLKALVVDDARKTNTHVGPVVSADQLRRDLDYIEIATNEGAVLVCGGDRVKREKEGFYLTPALFANTQSEMRLNQEEIFGPLAGVIRVRDYDEALAVANDTPFGLCAGICTTSLKHATHFKRNCEAGVVLVNLPTAGMDYHVPFGGRKASSFGSREQGRYAVEFYTVVKTAYTSA